MLATTAHDDLAGLADKLSEAKLAASPLLAAFFGDIASTTGPTTCRPRPSKACGSPHIDPRLTNGLKLGISRRSRPRGVGAHVDA